MVLFELWEIKMLKILSFPDASVVFEYTNARVKIGERKIQGAR